ncbi:hypothetical protein E7W39_03680 [Cronobacter sakazakii]|nr:hypothetical protein [Salmonella enterica]ECB4335336.1 hypothetical protein [Salmonella enterica subsp. enterica serovar Havana]EEH7176173.1 hypothetical protein [Salmonella enterica subsp. enterica]MCI0277997.1 hypothetical protein [Cronobacter sakazakii]EAO1844252.1 hypothetical protein [Salmonella enterica]
MFSMIVLRMKACPQHSTGKEGVTISLNFEADIHPIMDAGNHNFLRTVDLKLSMFRSTYKVI